MSNNDEQDFESRVESVVAQKPAHISGSAVTFEATAWAVQSLEAAGIHPSLKNLSLVVGKQVPQRELVPFVNKLYRERSEDPKRCERTDGEGHIKVLYGLITDQVRAQMKDEFSKESLAAKEAWEEVDRCRGLFEEERQSASRQVELAESVRSEVQAELEAAREERVRSAERAERMASTIGDVQRENLDLKRRIEFLDRKNCELKTTIAVKDARLSALGEKFAQHRRVEVSNKGKLRRSSEVVATLLTERDRLQTRLDEQLASAERMADDFTSTSNQHRKTVGELERSKANIARARVTISKLNADLSELRAKLSAATRREARSIKNLEAMRRARDRALVVAKEAQDSSQKSRQMAERLLRCSLATRRLAERDGVQIQSSRQDL